MFVQIRARTAKANRPQDNCLQTSLCPIHCWTPPTCCRPKRCAAMHLGLEYLKPKQTEERQLSETSEAQQRTGDQVKAASSSRIRTDCCPAAQILKDIPRELCSSTKTATEHFHGGVSPFLQLRGNPAREQHSFETPATSHDVFQG